MLISHLVAAAGLLRSALALPGPGSTSASQDEANHALRRSLAKQSLVQRDTTFKNSTSIAKSFDGATLYSGSYDFDMAKDAEAQIELSVVCTTCYVTADITAELRIFNGFNASAGIADIASKAFDDVKNITNGVVDDIRDSMGNNLLAFSNFQFDDMQWPVIDEEFALDTLVSDLPDVQFSATLDKFDFYVELATSLTGSASYELNLYTSQTDFGIRIDNETEIGVFVTVDLLMSVSGAVTVDSGFHLTIDDGLEFIIDLFASNVSSIAARGGHFEFLPITADGEVELNAILRVGIHAGVGFSTETFSNSKVDDLFDYSAGVDTVMFVDVANLTTIVTATNNGTAGTAAGIDDQCNGDFAAAERFELGLGAGVGASVVIADVFSWGIGPTALLPVYYTTVGACPSAAAASTAAPTAAPTPVPAARRDDSTTVTLSTSVTYSAVGCQSTGLVHCPLSLQTTLLRSQEITTVLTVASDDADSATWPASTATADITTKAFGNAASSMLLSVSGSPTMYTPPSSGTPGTTTVFGHTVDNKIRNIAIGVSVGVGVPFIALAVWSVVACFKMRDRKAAKRLYKPVTSQEMMSHGN